MKFTLELGVKAEVLLNEETGIFVETKNELRLKEPFWQEVMRNCALLEKWDKKNEDERDMFSCTDRFTNRLFLQIKDN